MSRRQETLTDPLRELLRVQQRMNELCERAMASTDFEATSGVDAWAPVSDIYDGERAFAICLELPGIAQDEIDLRLEAGDLVVEGSREMDRENDGEQFHRVERAYGKFSRRFHLPPGVDRGAVRATYRDGLLLVELPKQSGSTSGPVRVKIG